MNHKLIVHENILKRWRFLYFLFLDYFNCIFMSNLNKIIIGSMNLCLQFFELLFIIEFFSFEWIKIWHIWTQILLILLYIFLINHQIIPDSFAIMILLLILFIVREIFNIKIINWTVHFMWNANISKFLDLFVSPLQITLFFIH